MAPSHLAPCRSLLLLAAAFTLACGEPSPAPAASPPAATPPAPVLAAPDVAAELHQGIDVSGHSGSVDWQQVLSEGHTYAFVKATEGMDFKDPDFDQNWAGMKSAGLVRGAYHFYVTEDDPAAQASFFLSTVTFEPGDLVPVVDVETLGKGTNTTGLADRLRQFLAAVEAKLGVKPILYTSPGFWNQNLGSGFGDYPLWVAEYGVDAPKVPNGWTTWHLWQFQEDATVAGVQDGADLSKVNRSGPDLGALVVPAGGSPAVQP